MNKKLILALMLTTGMAFAQTSSSGSSTPDQQQPSQQQPSTTSPSTSPSTTDQTNSNSTATSTSDQQSSLRGCLAQGNDLRMSGGVVIQQVAIVPPANDLAILDY